MALLIDSGFGLESIAREIVIILVDNLNTELALVESEWTAKDTALARKLERPDNPITLERIKPKNFHLGHKPSLIEAPPEDHPNISVMAERSVPAEDQLLDHVHVFMNAIAIEVMVKAKDSEDQANRRTWRTIDAINRVLMKNRTLNGLVEEISDAPSVFVTDVLKRRATKGHGEDWFWQGSRIDYDVTKLSTL